MTLVTPTPQRARGDFNKANVTMTLVTPTPQRERGDFSKANVTMTLVTPTPQRERGDFMGRKSEGFHILQLCKEPLLEQDKIAAYETF